MTEKQELHFARNIGLEIPEEGVDLAKLIYDVAQECDTAHIFRRTIDASEFLDKISIQIEIAKIHHENPHLPEDEVQKLVDATIAENNRKKEEVVVAKAVKREKIKQLFHGNAVEGYELAYSICQKDSSAEAKELSYCMLSMLRHLPIEERLEICRSHVESLVALGESGNNIAKVYCRMAGLVYPVSKKMDYSLCLSFYEKAYEYIDEPSRMLDEIIGFCNLYRINELREKCIQKKAKL